MYINNNILLYKKHKPEIPFGRLYSN